MTMKCIVDIFCIDQREPTLWADIVSLGGDSSHPDLTDFKQAGLRLALLDKRVQADSLDADVHIEII